MLVWEVMSSLGYFIVVVEGFSGIDSSVSPFRDVA